MNRFFVVFFSFCFGACLGSFANAAAMRTVAEKKWWGSERSVCDSCGYTLSFRDLIPVVSFVMLGGKCRKCRAAIPPRHFIAELCCGALAAVFAWRFGVGAPFFFALLSLPFLAFHTMTDTETGYIYDSWALAMAAAAMAARCFGGTSAVVDGALGALVGFLIIVAIIVISFGRMGTGDAVLMIGIGAFMGFRLTLVALYLGFMAGGVVVTPLLLAKKVSRKSAVPLGPFLCAGAAAAMLFGERIIYFFGYFAKWPWDTLI